MLITLSCSHPFPFETAQLSSPSKSTCKYTYVFKSLFLKYKCAHTHTPLRVPQPDEALQLRPYLARIRVLHILTDVPLIFPLSQSNLNSVLHFNHNSHQFLPSSLFLTPRKPLSAYLISQCITDHFLLLKHLTSMTTYSTQLSHLSRYLSVLWTYFYVSCLYMKS